MERLDNIWRGCYTQNGMRAIRERSRGQSTVEYLLVSMALVVFFAGMFGFLQGQLTRIFEAAGVRILSAYF